MRRLQSPLVSAALAFALALSAPPSAADPPNGASFLKLLGTRAEKALAPHRNAIGALVRVPPGLVPASVGLEPFVPGLARLRAPASGLLAFAAAHPDLPMEVAPPPHVLLDQVGQWTHAVDARRLYDVDGTGVLIGVADTGLDVSLADFIDPATGHSRVAWLLDLSLGTSGNMANATLEATFGGAVYQGTDIDALLAAKGVAPTDYVGHGTHVTSIATGNGGAAKKYVGIAPGAQIIFARIARGGDDSISNDDLLTGVQFLFDRADAMRRPIAANLSIGSDFGPHDGTMDWEVALASYVGPSHPGHALIVAAGNSGDVTAEAVHASVYVPPGGARSVPVSTEGALDGQVQVWVTMRQGANLSVGLDGPDGTWIAPVGVGQMASSGTASTYQAGVSNGSAVSMGQIPASSRSAIVIWAGNWPKGNYAVTLTGEGVADLYLEAIGDAAGSNGNAVNFVNGVREGTVNIPATEPSIIGVGCTVNRARWTSIDTGSVTVGITPLDARGGYPRPSAAELSPESGKVCWFSSAGPTVTGVPKPEISAPGGIVIGAMSQAALPDSSVSIFYNPGCPGVVDGGPSNPLCMEVDPTHGVAAGTSMSAPQVAGAAALLFQKDPTLTQDKIVALLQAGAHTFRDGMPAFEDQGGPGELDVQGSLDALAAMKDPSLVLPVKEASWLTVSADVVSADGSTPLTAIVELRTADGAHRADMFASTRLTPRVLLDDAPLAGEPPIIRKGPGLWFFTVTPPPGLGGHKLSVGANFDGAPIVAPVTVAIGTDIWTANYPSRASGSCAIGREGQSEEGVVAFALGLLCVRRRRSTTGRSAWRP